MSPAAMARGAFVAAVLALTLVTGFACDEEARSDSEILADQVDAKRCVVPSGRTGAIYTCEFGEGEPKRCYEVDWVPDASARRDQLEHVFRVTFRHEGACTRDDKP